MGAGGELHHAVPRAAVRELGLGDPVDARTMTLGDRHGAVGGTGIDDEQLDRAVNPLCPHGGEHLVEIPLPVVYGDRDGDIRGHHLSVKRRSPMYTRLTSRSGRVIRHDALDSM